MMANSSKFNVLKHYKVPPISISSAPTTTSLPLTFLDIPWLFVPPSQQLFFYEHPNSSTPYLLSTIVPKLKTTLSLALNYFFPFAANLALPRDGSDKPEIVSSRDDYVSFVVAESVNGDFSHLISHSKRNAGEFRPLVPELPTRVSLSSQKLALLAVQVTIFPNAGLCLGLAYHHVVADRRTFDNFMKAWTSLYNGSCSLPKTLVPSLDRTAMKDPLGLEKIFLEELWKRKSPKQFMIGNHTSSRAHFLPEDDKVRATFVVSPIDMEAIKQWIITQCKKKNRARPVHLSPYVLTCAFVWVSIVKSKRVAINTDSEQECCHFGFIAGGLTRLEFHVPAMYLGNCVGFGLSVGSRDGLLGEDGIIIAADAIVDKIKQLDKELFGGAKSWISDWDIFFGTGTNNNNVFVLGSPKLGLYETDFGFGKPKKIEDVSIDGMDLAISLAESRDVEGGMEVGLALTKPRMDAFSSLFIEGLKTKVNCPLCLDLWRELHFIIFI